MNGTPLTAQTPEFAFESDPPRRLGDEALISTPDGKVHHVVWLRGLRGRKQWLVDVEQLKAYHEADFRNKMAGIGVTA